MLTTKNCGKCALDKRTLAKKGYLDSVNVQDAVANPLVAKLRVKTVPTYIVLNSRGKAVFVTSEVAEFMGAINLSGRF